MKRNYFYINKEFGDEESVKIGLNWLISICKLKKNGQALLAVIQKENLKGMIENVLNRIIDRANTLEASGSDVSAVKAAIESAKSAIESSKSAIEAQAAKIYEITISAEENLRMDVGSVMSQMRSNLSDAKDTVKVAQDAIKDASSKLKEIVTPPVSEEDESES